MSRRATIALSAASACVLALASFVAGAIVLAVCGAALPVAAVTLLDRAAP